MAKNHNDLRTNVRFDRFVVILNPASTNLRFAQKKIAELHRLAGDRPIDNVETSTAGHAANVALLVDKISSLKPRTLLCVAAGDGTINAVVEALVLGKGLSPSIRRTPILPLWGGNANDLAWTLNGPAARASLETVLAAGQVVPIRPLCIRLTSKNGNGQVHIATFTTSFGASARIMHRLNSASFRQSFMHHVPGGRFAKEAFTAWKTAMDAPTFVAAEGKTSKNMYEYTLANGSRMAKHYHIPLQLTDDQFYLDPIEGKRFLTTATALVLSFKRRSSDEVLRKSLRFTTHEDVWAQFDGEAMKIAAQTTVEISLYKRPFYALSTRLEHVG